MKQPIINQKKSAERDSLPDFHGATIITESGTEIPITEQMLQKTFKTLIEAWEQSRISKARKSNK